MAIFIGNPGETSLSEDWGAELNKRDMPNSQQRRRGITWQGCRQESPTYFGTETVRMAGMWAWS